MSESIFDLRALEREFECLEYEREWDNPDIETKRLYLGSVFALMPSGKYYTPWACSNLDTCGLCGGSGTRATLASVASGIVRGIQWAFTRTYYTVKRHEWALSIYKRLFYLLGECPNCGGLGSRDAWLDQEWRESAESELESIGAYLTSGEGDPCDLFACVSRECEREKEYY